MLELMDDLDLLLSTDKNWLLGCWLERAKTWGDDILWITDNDWREEEQYA